MNILVTDLFSVKNKGDAAIASVTLSELKKVFPEANFKLVTTDPFENGAEFENVKLVHSLFYETVYKSINPLVRIMRIGYIVGAVFVWLGFYKLVRIKLSFLLSSSMNELLNETLKADLIVPKGGGYLLAKNSYSSTVSLLLQLFGIWIPTVFKKKVILYSQSIGPFGTALQARVTKYVLNRTTAVFSRESHSIKALKQIGVTKPAIVESADAALLFKANTQEKMKVELKTLGIDFSKPVLGITVTRQLSDQPQADYETAMSKFAKYVAGKNIQVVFVPQVISPLHNDDDTKVQKRIENMIGKNPNVLFISTDYDYKNIKGIYENFDYLVGTRMHSAIFALTGGVPTVAIAYEYKTLGVMESLGLLKWCLEMKNLQYDKLVELFEQLLLEKQGYLNVLKNNLEKQQLIASQTAMQVKELFYEV